MIRNAVLRDFTQIIGLVQDFARASPLPYHNVGHIDIRRTQNTLLTILKTGVILVDENLGTLRGVIMGQITPDLLFPEYRTLREIVWWVSPEHRHTTAGYKLLQHYIKQGKELQARGVIQDIVMTTLVNSPELRLAERGWQPIETNYLYQGVN